MPNIDAVYRRYSFGTNSTGSGAPSGTYPSNRFAALGFVARSTPSILF